MKRGVTRDIMTKLKLDLELVLPSDASACDACVERILASLRGKAGVVEAHVDATDTAKPKLCLHYDPGVVRLERVQVLVEQAGAELRARFEHLSVPVAGLRHERQAKLVEGVFAKEPGVLHAAVAFGARRLYVEFDPSKTSRAALLAALGGAGLDVRVEGPPVAAPAKGNEEVDHERSELVFSLSCGALTAIGWAIGKMGVSPFIPTAPTALFLVAYLLGSWFTLKEVVVALRARKFEIDFLMLLAAAGAAVLGEWFEGALLLFLFTLGHALEGFAMSRARKAIEALSKLVPETALRIDASGLEIEVAVAELAVGDRILVKPNTRIPADGFVLSGTSSVNQAPSRGRACPSTSGPYPMPNTRRPTLALLPPRSVSLPAPSTGLQP